MSTTETPPPADSPLDPNVEHHHHYNGTQPRGPLWKRLLFGPPISTQDQDHSRLSKRLALPIFSSDAISSVAYATQEILLALGAAGLAVQAYAPQYGAYLWGVTLAIVVLLIVVAISYRQTIFAYPSGGGSYIVTKDNLGTTPGLIAAAALLIDYVLTVSVSVASGVQNLLGTPLFEKMHLSPEGVCLIFIGLLTLANMRGLKESGQVFAIPTYLFIGMAYLMIALGLIGPSLGWTIHVGEVNQLLPSDYAGAKATPAIGLLGVFVALRAFANGCSAMTGTEAISNGIPAFRRPESKNAATTLTWMAVILGTLFLGTSALAAKLHVVYWEQHGVSAPAVIDQFSTAIFGHDTWWRAALYYVMQFSTVGILVLAANTSFADFPRLASILANDRFLPKELAHRGDRLVFGRGILLLGFFAALLIIVFRGSVDRLIPLYALGVFTAFTLSQSGMVKHWQKERGPGWTAKATVNGIGAITTGIVFLAILVEKGPEGAWVVIVVAAILVALFSAINNRYITRAQGLALAGAPVGGSEMTDVPGSVRNPQSVHAGQSAQATANAAGAITASGSNGASTLTTLHKNLPDAPVRNTVLVLVPGIHRGILPAINYARLLAPTFRAVYIEIEPELTPAVEGEWHKYVKDIPLIVLESPYRSLIAPLLEYIDEVTREYDDDVVTLVIPESFSGNFLDTVLRSTAAAQLKLALLGREDVVVVNVRYRLTR